MNKEIWKTVEGFQDYAISNHGRVKRITSGRSTRKGKILKSQISTCGYPQITLRNADKKKTFLVHKLEYITFKGPIPEGLEINHKDGDKENNYLTNFELMTRGENISHSFSTGLRSNVGTNNSMSKLSNQQVHEIKHKYDEGGYSQSDLADMYEVSQPSISRIVNSSTYTNA